MPRCDIKKGKVWAKPNHSLTRGHHSWCPASYTPGCTTTPCKRMYMGLVWTCEDCHNRKGSRSTGRYWGRRKSPQGAGLACIKPCLCKGLTQNRTQLWYPGCSEGSKSRLSQCCDENFLVGNSSTRKHFGNTRPESAAGPRASSGRNGLSFPIFIPSLSVCFPIRGAFSWKMVRSVVFHIADNSASRVNAQFFISAMSSHQPGSWSSGCP